MTQEQTLRERVETLRAFLGGTGDLDGRAFGEKPEDAKGNFWWRKHLTALDDVLASLPTPPEEWREAAARIIDPQAWDDEIFAEPGGAGQRWRQADALKRATAVLALIQTAPGGWRLVPVEPTREMREAALRTYGDLLSQRIPVFVSLPAAIQAAIAAAPAPDASPPASQGDEG